MREMPDFPRYTKPLNNVNTNTTHLPVQTSESSDEDFIYSINSLSEKKHCVDFNTVVNIEKQRVRVLIDTGASINILNMRSFNQLNERLRKPLILQKTKTKVVTYGSEQTNLKVKGVVELLVETVDKFTSTKFYVIDTEHKNLLSGTSAVELNILKLNKSNISKINTCHEQRSTLINKTPDYSFNYNKASPTGLNAKKERQHISPLTTIVCQDVPERLHSLIMNYEKSVFSGKIGKLKDHKVKFHIDNSIPPVAQKERRIPFALRKKVNIELERLERAGIIEDVTNLPTPWLNPLVVVPKGEEDVRICLDMRCANKAITRTRFPTPTVDDLLVKLKGSAVFTKLDLKSAFHQLELDETSRHMTAFQTDTKVKRYTRLIFGANSAAEELQQALRLVLADIDGSLNIADDILIYAENDTKHDKILQKVLQRLHDKGLTLNLNKCLFCKRSLEYYGYVFSERGMQPSVNKITAIQEAKQPENQKAVRSFLGLTNYLKRFIEDYSTLTYPLRQLLKQNTDFIWTDDCNTAFIALKDKLTSEKCISYFDEEKETFIYTDASPFGISAILLQKSVHKDDSKVISYSSRSLTETEQRYSQLERECLALVYGCEKNRLYIFWGVSS